MCRCQKKYRKTRLAQHKTIKKVVSETAAAGHSNIPNRRTVSQLVHVCNNACKEIETQRGYSMQTAIRCTAQPAVGYFETLVESHVLSKILYISSVRFSVRSFLLSSPPFFSLLSLLSTYPRFIYSHLLASGIVTQPRHER